MLCIVYCSHLQLAAPIGRSPFAALPLDPFPPQAVVPIDLSPPFVLPRPPCPILPSLLPFPFPWYVVPTEPPDFACFTALCRVHTVEGNSPRRWPGASKRSSQTGGEGPLPNGCFWALGCPLAGSFP